MGGWVGGWMDGWMEVKAGLRIAYSNQQSICMHANELCAKNTWPPELNMSPLKNQFIK